MRTNILLVMSLSALLSCANSREAHNIPGAISYVNLKTHNKSIIIESLTLDTLDITPQSSSFTGDILITRNKILFVDPKLCWVYQWDKNGKYIGRFLGQGAAPSEIPVGSIQFFCALPKKRIIFIGNNWDCYMYDKHLNRVDEYSINWYSPETRKKILLQPDPSKNEMYNLLYGIGEIRYFQNHIYIPIYSQHERFNPTTLSYGRDARIFAVMDVSDGYVCNLAGRLSPLFNSVNGTRVFPYAYMDFTGRKQMAITFPPDSLIYLFDNKCNMITSFGFSGRNMDTSYLSIGSKDSLHKEWVTALKTKGYYSSLTCISKSDLIFRSYKKGIHQMMDGLQVYRSGTLVADIDVPKGFSVRGYIKPYFYSCVFIDEVKEKIVVYRFKLSKLL